MCNNLKPQLEIKFCGALWCTALQILFLKFGMSNRLYTQWPGIHLPYFFGLIGLCCCSPSTSKMCCVFRDAVLHTTVVTFLFELLSPFCPLEPVWAFSSDCFCDAQTTLSGTNNPMVKFTEIIFLRHSDIWSKQQLNPMGIFLACIELLLLLWLIRYLH